MTLKPPRAPCLKISKGGPNEVWKPFHQGSVDYEVSNYGRVRRYLRPFVSKGMRYPQVYLSGGQKVTVHTLVAREFLGPCPPGKEVNHKDGTRDNNRPENLEYLTHRENMEHGQLVLHRGRCTLGFRTGWSFSPSDFKEIVRLRNNATSYKDIASQFNCTLATIRNALHKMKGVH